MSGRGLAAVAVRSLERGFQGENLSVDDWGLLGDWGLRQYLQFKQLGEQDGFVARTAVAAQTERGDLDACFTEVSKRDRHVPPSQRKDSIATKAESGPGPGVAV